VGLVDLTEEGSDSGPVPERSHPVLALHEDLRQGPGTRPAIAAHLVDAVGVAGRRFSRQLTI
jgi:hypothetical protein